MAPDTVRTVPPWVVTRPPQSVLPTHNAQPSHPHPRRSSARASTAIPADDDDADDDPSTLEPGVDDRGLGHGPKTLLPQLFKRKAGRRWDHLRSAEPVIVPQHRSGLAAPSWSAQHGRWGQHGQPSPWRDFVQSSRYPHIPNEESEVVDEAVMAKLQPSFGYPRDGGAGGGGSAHSPVRGALAAATHRAGHAPSWWARLWSLPIRHPLGPLACRLTVLSTSLIALALAARIFQTERLDNDNPTPEQTQIVCAIVVDVVAVPYIGYITVDDYTGKPLGLRPPKARIRLILMDLFFIIFKSASTALGFEAMLYFSTPSTLSYLRALGAFELVGLISWAMTLTINVFREIERLGG